MQRIAMVGSLAALLGCAAPAVQVPARPPVPHLEIDRDALPQALSDCPSDEKFAEQMFTLHARVAEAQRFYSAYNHSIQSEWEAGARRLGLARKELRQAQDAQRQCRELEREAAQREKDEAAKRAEEEKAHFATEVERLVKELREPEREALLLNVLMCEAGRVQKWALEQIEEEKEAASVSGIIDRSRIYDLQKTAIQQRKLVARYREAIAQRTKVAPKKCDDEGIWILGWCHVKKWPEPCYDSLSPEDTILQHAIRRSLERLDLDG